MAKTKTKLKEEKTTQILETQLSSIYLKDYPDEQHLLTAILNGSINALQWQIDSRGEFFAEMPICAGHIYSQPQIKGPRPAPVMVIGKLPRPADIEDEENPQHIRTCFHTNSKAGQYFLDTALEFGVDPANWYVTYLLKTLHPEDPNKGSRLRAPWLRESFPILQYEITQVSPSYILVFGAEAVKALFGNHAKITKLTGSVLDYEYMDYQGHIKTAKCVACTSPYAVTRSSDVDEEAKYRTAFQLFASTLTGTAQTEQVEHYTVRTIEEWRELLTRIETECDDKILAIDAEWNGQHPQNENGWLRTIQFSWKPNTAAALVVRDVEGKDCFTQEELEEIKSDFYNRLWMQYIICGHFLDSDTEWLIGEGYVPKLWDIPYVPKTGEEYIQRIKDKQPCLFDTAMAAHAYEETGDHSLTAQSLLRCPSAPRYDNEIGTWATEFCKANKIKQKDLEGYGPCPDEILVPYGCYDADVTRRIALWYMERLNRDVYGLDCWGPFSNSMQQWAVFLEMNCTGLTVDRERLDDLMDVYSSKADNLIENIRNRLEWPRFNINSHYQMREALFGEKYNFAKTEGCLRPVGAKSLMLTPLYSTSKLSWEKAVEKDGELAIPTSDARSLNMLATEYFKRYAKSNEYWDKFVAETLTTLRNAKILKKALSYVLKDAVMNEAGEEQERGLSAFICDDNKLRTHLYCTLDSGRAASARPALQNISKKREADYKKIVGKDYIAPLRSILRAPEGCMLIAADFLGAELFACAVLSDDEVMLDHVQRNQLPEEDENFYDIHSSIAVTAFRLDCAPTKSGLKSLDKLHLRVVAKAVIFGLMYGRGAAAIADEVRESGVFITVEEARQMIDAVKKTYRKAMAFLESAAMAAYSPGWIAGVCGRYRRAPKHEYLPDDKLAELQRVFKNFCEQNYVAEAMRMALTNLYHYRFEHDIFYEICLQVHDELILCAPYEYVEEIVDKVLPLCMVENTALYPRHLNGQIDTSRGPYKMGIDVEVSYRYSEKEPDWRKICRENTNPKKL